MVTVSNLVTECKKTSGLTASQAGVRVTVGRCGQRVPAATPTNPQAVFLNRPFAI